MRDWDRKYSAALKRERLAWREVEQRLPGTANYDEGAWQRWCEAVRAVDAIARGLS